MTDAITQAAPPRIPIAQPLLGPEEVDAVRKVIESGWLVQGPMVAEFEKRFSSFTGAGHSIASTSCTTALHLSVAALGLKPGDEVIVPAFTWISTANVVEYMGARPVFVDVDPRTFNIDPGLVAEAITDRTVGILPVHLFGLCADMGRIGSIAQENGLWVVEDAACGFGAWHPNGHAGTLGNLGCFSFHPRKAITTGEGGMVTTKDQALADIVRSLRDHGADRTDLARHSASDGFLLPTYKRLGYNYRLTDLQAAVGCAQMERAGHIIAKRREQAKRYDEALSEVGWLRPPYTPAGYVHGYQAYVTWFGADGAASGNIDSLSRRRNQLMTNLEKAGISTRQGTHAAALQEYYRHKYDLSAADFPVAHAAERRALALPLFPTMSPEEQQRIMETLTSLGPE